MCSSPDRHLTSPLGHRHLRSRANRRLGSHLAHPANLPLGNRRLANHRPESRLLGSPGAHRPVPLL